MKSLANDRVVSSCSQYSDLFGLSKNMLRFLAQAKPIQTYCMVRTPNLILLTPAGCVRATMNSAHASPRVACDANEIRTLLQRGMIGLARNA